MSYSIFATELELKEILENKGNQIGQGSFGSIYKSSCARGDVAVKESTDRNSSHNESQLL